MGHATAWPYFYARISNELYTVKEWEKLVLKYRVSEAVCDIVNISPKETYWFFGARFQNKEE